MMRRHASKIAAAFMILCVAIAADAPIRVTGQLLDYERGYVFFTTGDGFRVSSNVQIRDYSSSVPLPLTPAPRDWARATFDASGTVVELDLSKKRVPAEGDFSMVRRFAVAISPTLPNPDLSQATPGPGNNGVLNTFSGKPVPVSITVEVPPTTPLTASVYMSTDKSGWDPQAYRMDRIDALHFHALLRLNSGTQLAILFTRGSVETEERGPGYIEPKPYVLTIYDADVNAVSRTVYAWADQTPSGNQNITPFVLPTPYNPAPFPNLPPGAPGAPPTPHPPR
jgi:hypothetical protein